MLLVTGISPQRLKRQFSWTSDITHWMEINKYSDLVKTYPKVKATHQSYNEMSDFVLFASID